MPKRKTNMQVVKQMMEHSQYGALSQAFIMEAISRYADQCAAADPAMFDSPMMHGASWVGTAKEIQATLKAHFAS